MLTSAKLAHAYRSACMAELEALKPGNVHVFADGHGMRIHDFIKSADASAAVIAQANLSVGERIFQSVKATQMAVGMNTNLGIILLCAPLIHAALHVNQISEGANQNLQQRLGFTLSQLTVEDATLTGQAIVLANPGGLGNSNVNDVHEPSIVSLLEMMASAQDKDRIAWQYANGFADVFEFGLPHYNKAMHKWNNQAWATTALYLGFLARQLDSHVIRKYGEALAKEVMQEAIDLQSLHWATENPKLVQKHLLAWDASLKSRNINPGTSADLTVTCLMVSNFEEIV
ncbi:triphosphoribosyl-dephospho-CoA synthase [Methylotenera versatilis]|uniref:Triphosphoribosyl-dephospho-CoA protein n=1 Tax=Methylotenera versatilis (strain 301) TaxID=666681 RepID=D7DIP7_METV0|nr:triphosphoribosyl-dephospho-CoA synthase [Methylotenera versatilis]ADI29932.1 triphosphoribosyl-dephospho-CoA protein [Methylotenera versatilis 301]